MNEVSLLKQTRGNLIKATEELSIDQLERIPEHFNNNIIWNLGHVLVTQQLLIYKFSGLEPMIDSSMIDRYRKGTFPPEGLSVRDEYEQIVTMLMRAAERLETDLGSGIFKDYQTYETSYGVILKDVYGAIRFNNLHESMHLGYVLAMKHLLP